jgi:hypothetical protein
MNKNKIEYQLPNLSNDISHSDYKYMVGSLDALCNVFDFINNKTLVNQKEVLTFITDEMTKRGAFNLKINISNNNK